jgi:hypothetical protein
VLPSNARIAPTTTAMMPIVQMIATFVINPIMSRITPTMIKGAPDDY